MGIEEIQVAIESLPPDQYVRLRQWFSERNWEQWDRQIEADVKAGKLEKPGEICGNYECTAPRFWKHFENLPAPVQEVAEKNFELLRTDPTHPSLHFKRVGKLWSVRAGSHHRALAIERRR